VSVSVSISALVEFEVLLPEQPAAASSMPAASTERTGAIFMDEPRRFLKELDYLPRVSK
jgi:hypothetical protein